MIQDIYPLSPAQQGMLFHSLVDDASGVYVVQVGFTLVGSLAHSAFKSAWQKLIDRHDLLRTAFVWENVESPLQVVGKKASFKLAELPSETDLADWLSEDRKKGFQLTAAPLFRVATLPLGPNKTRVIWTYHHLVLDGWSLPLLFQEWLQHYTSAQPQLSPALPYKDYIRWLGQRDDKVAIDYWKRYLDGYITPISLPPAGDSGSHSVHFRLSTKSTEKLHQTAKRERVTLSTIVNGAWAILLSRYGDQDDVVFGLARSGRPPELERIERRVGMFINTMPLRIDVAAEDVFEWLRSINNQQQEQQPHEHISLTEVHQASQLPRNLPLFESVVVFENYPINESAIPDEIGVRLEDVQLEEQTNYPLSLFVVAGAALEGKLYFSQLGRDLVENIACDLAAILEEFASSGTGIRPSQLFPTPASCDSGEQFSVEELMPVHQSFAQKASASPDKTAAIFGDTELTYAELDARVDALAAKLPRGATIGILQKRSIEMVVSLLAVLKAGCHYVPLDPSHPAARRDYILKDANVDLLLDDSQTVDRAGAASKADASQLAYLIYTSGTTGNPKGVPITHENLANLVRAMADRIGFTKDNRLLALTTLAFDIAALEIFLPLVTGGTVVIADEAMTQDGEKIVAAIQRHRIDTVQGTPATWQLIHAAQKDFPALRILCGGEAIPHELANSLVNSGAIVWNVYGPTETTIWSGALQLTSELLTGAQVPVGGPLANTTFHLLDSRNRPVPHGVAGELCIGGAGLSPGYHGKPDLTKERFVHIHETDTLVYRTGDQVLARADGNFEFLGRTDYQIKLRGYRIELPEIEAALQTHPAVKEAVAVLQNEGNPEARIVAAIIGQAETSDLKQHLADRLPSYMLPAVIHQLKEFPLTPNRKIDRKAIAKLATESVSTGAPPSTDLEKSLAEIWRGLLQVDSVSIHDNFFEMGGHSLLILKAQNKLREKVGVDLPLADLFRHPTLASLAAHIGNTASDKPETNRSDALQAGRSRLAQRRRIKA
ncbi:MAG: non-ribosomal peptide synthase [Verrucomicrobiales bacterium]|nr:non-ribosomal peptide synthase [Verrucomicrobiales bacterium]